MERVVVPLSKARAARCAPLLQPYRDPRGGGGLDLQHRVVMGAVTRGRAARRGNRLTPLNAEYYAQRSSRGGLLLGEAAAVGPRGVGVPRMPGLWEDAQVDGWREACAAAAAAGGQLWPQLWHAGRSSVSSVTGAPPLAPSAIGISPPPEGWHAGISPHGSYGASGAMEPWETPEEMTETQIREVVVQHGAAAARAEAAGASGVDLCMAGGGLLHTFLNPRANRRGDQYRGDTVEGRLRLPLECFDAAAAALGSSRRVGVTVCVGFHELSLYDTAEEHRETLGMLGDVLRQRGAAYLHAWSKLDCAVTPTGIPGFEELVGDKRAALAVLRTAFDGPLMVSGFLTDFEKAAQHVQEGRCDLAVFGFASIGIPDLARRLRHGADCSQQLRFMQELMLQSRGGKTTMGEHGADGVVLARIEPEPSEAEDRFAYTDWAIADLPEDPEPVAEPPGVIHL